MKIPVPPDPFDGKPLRYKKREDGVTIYSVGRDSKDDGGKLQTKQGELINVDYGFRLSDPQRRRALLEELRRVHALSLLSFRENFLYSPISEADFLAQYSGVRSFMKPELTVLAEKDGELIGYFFTLPDLLRPKHGKPVDTVILKTMAVHPDHGGIGLGSVLMARAH